MFTSKKQNNFLLLILTTLIVVVVFFIYTQFDFLPTSTDSIRILIGAEEIKDDGELHKNIYENGGFTPYEKETNFLYPQFQILIFTLSQIAGVDFHIITTLLAVMLSGLIFCAFYLLVKYSLIYLRPSTRFARSGNIVIAMLSALFLFFSLSIGRSILLTPQNLFGYLFIILGILFLLRYLKNRSKSDLLIFILFLIGLFHFHHLSFFVFLVILFFFLLFEIKGSRKWIFLGASIVIAGLGFLFLRYVLDQTYLIGEFKNAIILSKGENANSIFDLPAQIGYILFLLMAWGILKIKKLSPSVRRFTIISTLVIFVLSYLHYFGIYYFPDRMILFFIIPAVFLVPLALSWFQKDLKRLLFIPFLGLLLAAQIFHFTDHLRSNVSQFTSTFIPDEKVLAAYNFLNENSTKDDTVLSTYYGKNRSSIYLPYFYKGNVSLWHSNDLTVSPSKKEPQKADTVLSKLFKDTEFVEPNQEQLLADPNHHLYLMTVAPKNESVKKYFKEYNVKYILLYKDTEPLKLYHKNELPVVFENDQVTIFKYEE